MSDSEIEQADLDEVKIQEIHRLVVGNIKDIHNIRNTLEHLLKQEGEIDTEEPDLEELRFAMNNDGPYIPGVDDNLEYFLNRCGIDSDDIENINSIKEENRELKSENNDLRRRLIESLDESGD